MPKLTVQDVAPSLDGEYDCATNDLTNRELHFIRMQSGIAPAGIVGGLLSGDAGLTVALATVVLERMGKPVDIDALWDAEGGNITFDFSDVGADEIPPEQPASGENEPESPAGKPDESETSG